MAPFYDYACPDGHIFTKYFSVSNHIGELSCDCGEWATQIISSPSMITVQPSIAYDSPIDGRHITTWDMRAEDLKRNGCRPYDPEMKKDAAKFRKDKQDKLEASLDETVAETITKMPTRERGKLYSDLVNKGLDIQVERKTV
jgi:hypothetical protein